MSRGERGSDTSKIDTWMPPWNPVHGFTSRPTAAIRPSPIGRITSENPSILSSPTTVGVSGTVRSMMNSGSI